MNSVRKIQAELHEIDCAQEYKSLEECERGKKWLLKEMAKLAHRGWRVAAFGFSNGFQGGWYALMTRDIHGKGVGGWA